MEKEALKQVITDQQEYKSPAIFFDRTLLKTIKHFVDDPRILIISGVKRSGKSTIQRLLQRELKTSNCYLNFDDARLIQFQVEDFQMLLEVFIELFGEQSTFYFDEIQNIEGWEHFVHRLYEQGKKIYITRSSTKLLSREFDTYLAGRHIQLEAYPLSFKELVQNKHPEMLSKKALSTSDVGMIQRHFSSYLRNGGIPEYVSFENPEYLNDLFKRILYKDVIARYKLNDEKPLREMTYYLSSNIGRKFSYKKLGSIVGLKSPHTVANYCAYLEQSYLYFFLNRYSHSPTKQIQSNKKCYMIDPALIRTVGFRVSEDKGLLLENVVFLHLKMQKKEIYFHKEKKECDFVIREGNLIIQAIQVTTNLSTEVVKEREVSGLIEAMSTYKLQEGLILTENEQETIEVEGFQITIMPIWKWLLSL